MFQERLKQLRKDRKVTQVQLAAHLGYYHSAVVKWESGQCEPSYDILIKIADYFDVTLDYLLGRTEPLVSATKQALLDEIDTLSEDQLDFVLCIVQKGKELKKL